ncbi:uncharacterized protein LOC144769666 [Lissotriton helveticus]
MSDTTSTKQSPIPLSRKCKVLRGRRFLGCAAFNIIKISAPSTLNRLKGYLISIPIAYTFTTLIPTIIWRLNSTTLVSWVVNSTNPQINDLYKDRLKIFYPGVINISSAVLTDSGNYTVTVKGPLDQILAETTIPVNIQDKITIFSPTVVETTVGGLISLPITYTPPLWAPVITWTQGKKNAVTWDKDNDFLQIDDSYKGRLEVYGAGSINISNAGVLDSGIYTVSVEGVDSGQVTRSIKVTVQATEPINISAPTLLNVLAGGMIIIPISYPSNVSNPLISWSKGVSPLVTWGANITVQINNSYNGRLQINYPGSISISNAVVTDSGNYTVTVEAANRVTAQAVVQVLVYAKAITLYYPTMLEVVHGAILSLQIAFPPTLLPATISWKRNSDLLVTWVINSSQLQINTAYLDRLQIFYPGSINISRSTSSDTGNYTVMVSEGADVLPALAVIPVTVYDEVKISTQTMLEVWEGDAIFIPITYLPVVPNATITWRNASSILAVWVASRNLLTIEYSYQGRLEVYGDGSVNISHAMVSDGGLYTVRVERGGQVFAQRDINVYVHEINISAPLAIDVLITDDILIMITYTLTTLTPTISWTMNGSTLVSWVVNSTAPKIKENYNDRLQIFYPGSITISKAVFNDTGSYTVLVKWADNILAQANISVNVYVTDVNISSPRVLEVWEGDTLSINIEHTYTDFLPTIVWVKNETRLVTWKENSTDPQIDKEYSDRLQITYPGSINISKANLNDKGNYTVTVEIDGKILAKATIEVMVNASEVINISAPKVLDVTNCDVILINISYSKTIFPPTVSWSINSTELTTWVVNTSLLQINTTYKDRLEIYYPGSINISEARFSDSGNYTVRVEAKHALPAEAVIQVNVSAEAFNLTTPEKVDIMEGGVISIPIMYTPTEDITTISWERHSADLVTWVVNSTLLKINSTYLDRMDITYPGNIRIANAMKSDSGEYTVKVKAKHKIPAENNILVNVYGTAIKLDADRNFTFFEGSTISIPIVYTPRELNPIITWTRNSNRIVSWIVGDPTVAMARAYQSRITIFSSGSLNISNAVLSDTGRYTVRAEGANQSATEIDIEVVILENNKTESLSGGQIAGVVVGTAVGVPSAIGGSYLAANKILSSSPSVPQLPEIAQPPPTDLQQSPPKQRSFKNRKRSSGRQKLTSSENGDDGTDGMGEETQSSPESQHQREEPEQTRSAPKSEPQEEELQREETQQNQSTPESQPQEEEPQPENSQEEREEEEEESDEEEQAEEQLEEEEKSEVEEGAEEEEVEEEEEAEEEEQVEEEEEEVEEEEEAEEEEEEEEVAEEKGEPEDPEIIEILFPFVEGIFALWILQYFHTLDSLSEDSQVVHHYASDLQTGKAEPKSEAEAEEHEQESEAQETDYKVESEGAPEGREVGEEPERVSEGREPEEEEHNPKEELEKRDPMEGEPKKAVPEEGPEKEPKGDPEVRNPEKLEPGEELVKEKAEDEPHNEPEKEEPELEGEPKDSQVVHHYASDLQTGKAEPKSEAEAEEHEQESEAQETDYKVESEGAPEGREVGEEPERVSEERETEEEEDNPKEELEKREPMEGETKEAEPEEGPEEEPKGDPEVRDPEKLEPVEELVKEKAEDEPQNEPEKEEPELEAEPKVTSCSFSSAEH